MAMTGPPALRPLIREAHPPSAISRWLDRVAASQFAPFGCLAPPYLVTGVAGLGAAGIVFTALLATRGYPPTTLVVVPVTGVAVFITLGLIEKALLGRERHAVMENVVLILAAEAVVLHLLHQPVLPALDDISVGLGVLLVFGRWGCLLHGCCHGRPSGFGVRYVQALHADDPLTGVRLFPLPLAEAMVLIVITAVGAGIALGAAPPGTALLFWLTAYAIARFVLGFARGDRARRLLGPLTQAQWIALGILAARIGYEQLQRVRLDSRGLLAVGGCAVVCAIAYLTRRHWFTASMAGLDRAETTTWQRLLPRLAPAAAHYAGGAQICATVHGQAIEITLRVERPGAVHRYTLRDADGGTRPRETTLAAGLILAQLGTHQVYSARVCASGSLHLTVRVDEASRAGFLLSDDPDEVILRACAAMQEIIPVQVDPVITANHVPNHVSPGMPVPSESSSMEDLGQRRDPADESSDGTVHEHANQFPPYSLTTQNHVQRDEPVSARAATGANRQ
jgi:Prolipoprotein diacylglyceryl transferase